MPSRGRNVLSAGHRFLLIGACHVGARLLSRELSPEKKPLRGA